jgi:hypothetical protein
MNKIDAKVLSPRLQACFNVFFQNQFIKREGKQWRSRQPENASDIAQNSITVKCSPGKTNGNARSFRINVTASEPDFVRPIFRIDRIDRELQQLFEFELRRATECVDFGNGDLFLVYKHEPTGKFIHFNFKSK